MNKTRELLWKIRAAVLNERLSAKDIPIAEIKQCVFAEIGTYQNTVTENQYLSILESYQRLNRNISEEEHDITKVIFWLDALILCIDMLSDMIHTLANKEYWEYKHRHHLQDSQIQGIINYIDKSHEIRVFNYDFFDEYMKRPVELYFDEGCQMLYVLYKGKKMYFPRSWDEEKAMQYFRSLLAEQDERSPHCYRHNGYDVRKGDVVVDVGAAEGIFTLDIIDIAKKVYLLEADKEWMEALQQTFQNEGEKIEIIYGFADSIVKGNRVTLDSLFTVEINYIKMDIEGYEKSALQGAKRLLADCENLRCAICAYHCKGDEEWIQNYLQRYGFITDVSEGYMCPDWTVEAYLEAELRRGIVFGKKEKKHG